MKFFNRKKRARQWWTVINIADPGALPLEDIKRNLQSIRDPSKFYFRPYIISEKINGEIRHYHRVRFWFSTPEAATIFKLSNKLVYV